VTNKNAKILLSNVTMVTGDVITKHETNKVVTQEQKILLLAELKVAKTALNKTIAVISQSNMCASHFGSVNSVVQQIQSVTSKISAIQKVLDDSVVKKSPLVPKVK
jgi:hypothetical protein